MNTELCNMTLVTRANGDFLVLDRRPKPGNPWSGWTFPGGHVEPGENLIVSAIREVREETGLTIRNLQFCGTIQWYNPTQESNYLVFLFRSQEFSGKLRDSREGAVTWRSRAEFLQGHLAPNMKKYLAVFEQPELFQAFGISHQTLELLDGNGVDIQDAELQGNYL